MNKIAFLNDGLRRTFARGKVVMTAGVAALPEDQLATVLDRVRHFDEFTKENDPHGGTTSAASRWRGRPTFSKWTTTPRTWKAARKTRVTLKRRRACSPSCAPTSTDCTLYIRSTDDGTDTTTRLSRLHRDQARRPGRVLVTDRCGVSTPVGRRIQRHPASTANSKC